MKEIRHTGIVVSDPEQMLHFYRDLLGLKVVRDVIESGGRIDKALLLNDAKIRIIKLSADDGKLVELLYFYSPPAKPTPKKGPADTGISHLAFTVGDLDFLYSKLSQEGIKFNCLPQESEDGYAKLTFCKDPEGNLIELVEVLHKAREG